MRPRLPSWGILSALGLAMLATGVVSTSYGANEFPPSLPPPPPCQEVNNEFTGDDCTVDFATSDLEFCFSDAIPPNSNYPHQSSTDDQVFVLGNAPSGGQDCSTVLVKETGYYAIFDSELSESCADQLDETGYLTIFNSCNGAGWAVEANEGDRFLVMDSDNTGAGCMSDTECAADQVCREGNTHGNCCVPADPVYMGTFLLVEGEENVICINHWCPEWKAELANGNQFGWVHDPQNPSANCVSADSIHFKIAATSIVCKQEGYIQACTGGCENGECLPHPCFEADCPDWCVMNGSGDAECVDYNPCGQVQCEHGCVFGLCLQGPGARGPDEDGDGFSNLADCDDGNADVNPDASENCDNDIDDNCDGFIDECGDGSIELGVGGSGSGSGSGGNAATSDDGGCGCRSAGPGGRRWGAWLALIALGALARRRRS